MITNYADLENKTILITGASRGIGHAIACHLAKNKSHIVFNYRQDEAAAQKLVNELLDLGATKVSPLKFDVTDTSAMKTQIDEFHKNNGPISGLVNNAGISKDQLALRVKEEDIETYKKEKVSLAKEIEAIEDKLTELNFTTKVEVDEAGVKLLQKHNLV